MTRTYAKSSKSRIWCSTCQVYHKMALKSPHGGYYNINHVSPDYQYLDPNGNKNN